MEDSSAKATVRVGRAEPESDSWPRHSLFSVGTQAFCGASEAAQAIFGLISELVGLRICVLTRIDLAKNTLTVVEALDTSGLGIVRGMVLPADEMPCDYVVRSSSAVRQSDLNAHPLFRSLPACTKLGLRSYLGVPLRRSDGTVWGTLAAADTAARKTTRSHAQIFTVLARLAVLEFEREEQREVLEDHAKSLVERLAMAEALEEERLGAVRLQTVLEAAATVSHEVNNPLTVLQLRLGRLMKRCLPGDAEMIDDLQVALEAADEINEVTTQLRSVVRPVSTHYLRGNTRMIDLAASTHDSADVVSESSIVDRWREKETEPDV